MRKRRTIKQERKNNRALNLVMGFILFIYILGAVILDVVFRCELYAEFEYSLKFLSIPALVAAYALFLAYRKINDLEYGFTGGLFSTGALWLTLTICAAGYVAGFNALTGEQEVCRIKGRVVEKFTTYIRHGRGHYISVLDPVLDRPVTVHVFEKEYEAISMGDMYRTEMTRGSLGLLYRKIGHRAPHRKTKNSLAAPCRSKKIGSCNVTAESKKSFASETP